MAKDPQNQHTPTPDTEEKMHRENPETECFDDVQDASDEVNSQADEANEIIDKELADIDAQIGRASCRERV